MKLHELDSAISQVCPIYGVASDGTIFFKTGATEAQIAAAISVMAEKLPALNSLADQTNALIDAQIATMEGATERGVREFLLYMTVAEAARSGYTEAQLYASNYGYRKAKDIETAIAALRAQRV